MKWFDFFRSKRKKKKAGSLSEAAELQDLSGVDPAEIVPPESRFTQEFKDFLASQEVAAEKARAEKEAADQRKWKKAVIIFTKICEKVRRGIKKILKKNVENKDADENRRGSGITLFTVNRYRSIVYNLLMSDRPLFYALPDDSKELRVAIFGSGKIGTEMFLASYWCGQMLNRELKITVVSAEKEEHFKKRIDHINNEILRTSKQTVDNNLLKIRKNSDELSDCYFSFEYIESDVYLDGLDTIMTAERPESENKNGRLADFDYFVVALGSDKKNMEIMEELQETIEHGEARKSSSRCLRDMG